MKRSPMPQRRQPIRPVSKKRRAEAPQRAAVVAETFARAGNRCEAEDLVPSIGCDGRGECHEIKARGTHPGSHLDATCTAALCSAHHEWVGLHPIEAKALGLRVERRDGETPA